MADLHGGPVGKEQLGEGKALLAGLTPRSGGHLPRFPLQALRLQRHVIDHQMEQLCLHIVRDLIGELHSPALFHKGLPGASRLDHHPGPGLDRLLGQDHLPLQLRSVPGEVPVRRHLHRVGSGQLGVLQQDCIAEPILAQLVLRQESLSHQRSIGVPDQDHLI